jgi:hypothetical protein
MCGIEFLKKPKRILIPQDNEGRNLKNEEWQPLRVHLDYSKIENNIGKFKKEDLIDLKERIMPKTQEILQSLFKVKRVQGKLKLGASNCDMIPVPDLYSESGEGVDADLVIFVLIDETGFFLQNHIEAAAIHCLQSAATRRPIAGYIQFKPELNVNNSTAVDYMVWLALHEITHILVFNDALYEDYIDSEMNPIDLDKVIGKKILPSGKKMSYIKTKNIIEKGKEHFGCKHFEGVPLEYNGGPGTVGAHWAKKYMNTDYMIGDSYGENLITDLTLALFEDSGWYKVDYEQSNLFLWGKNKGCEFFDQNTKCVEEDNDGVKTKFKSEYCTKLNYPTCSVSGIFRGNCRTRKYKNPLLTSERYFTDPTVGGIDHLTDKCPIAVEVKQGQNYYGGSCRVGVDTKLTNIEKVCPECACFMSNLIELPIAQRKKSFRFKQNGIIDDMNNSTNNSVSLKIKDTSNYIKQELPKLTTLDLKAQCFDYKCEGSDLYVVIKGTKVKCNSGKATFEGYDGHIVCPSAEVLCHSKFKCKFGCIEKYDNSKGFVSFRINENNK